jgi:superfamily I DNA/RNA helicase
MSAREWSPQQAAVFDAIEDDSAGHLVVEALAGTGKTTTIMQGLRHTYESDSVLMCAFNKKIATELGARAPDGILVKTLHALGLAQLRRAHGSREIDGSRVMTALREEHGISGRARYEERKWIASVVSRAKCVPKVLDAEALDAMADRAGCFAPRGIDRDAGLELAAQLLSEQAQSRSGSIDFDDMVWLPAVQRLRPGPFDWVFVDETQDLNATQLKLARMSCAGGGRICAVGDRHQAIYGFRGADNGAIPRMVRELHAHCLPLTVSYRCPQAVAKLARRWVPSFNVASNNPAGVVAPADEDCLLREVAPGDFVISRTNAPLVSLCYDLLARGTRAIMLGRDVGKALKAWLQSFNACNTGELAQSIMLWEASECARLEDLDRDTDAVTDKASVARALMRGADSLDDLWGKLDRLFTDDADTPAVILTSTHKAKGLEADRCWLLCDTFGQNPKAPQNEEKNLAYVAVTRAMRELRLVGPWGKGLAR